MNKHTALAIIVLTVFAVGSASATIFDYKLVKATGFDDAEGGVYKWKFDAYLIVEDGKYTVVQYNKKIRRFSVYEISGSIYLHDQSNAGFRTQGMYDLYPNSWDVGFGKYKPDGFGGLAALSIRGGRVDPEYSEHGSFKLKKNVSMTKKAALSSSSSELEYVLSYLISKGFQPYD